MRPDLPLNRIWSPRLKEIVNICWDQDPTVRPLFPEIENRIQALRSTYGEEKESPKPPSVHLTPTTETASGQTSPDMRPVPLPNLPRKSLPQKFRGNGRFTDGIDERHS